MDITVIGTGKIGRTLGEALAAAGHDVRYGSRTPEESVREALDGAETVIVGIPGQSGADFARDHADELAGKVVIDASNKFGDGPAHSAAEFAVLAPAARYARAFNALGWENFADPVFDGVVADLFYSADEATTRPSNASSTTPASTPSTSAPASTTCSTNSSSSGSALPTVRAAAGTWPSRSSDRPIGGGAVRPAALGCPTRSMTTIGQPAPVRPQPAGRIGGCVDAPAAL
jgi:8-hydroxy-5-deazaflavin:NADPH oxidoreductase